MRSRPLRVACVGHAALDHVFEVEAFPSQPTKTLAHHFELRPGGMSLHAAVASARLGAQVRLLARVGSDAAAATLRARLASEGVEPRGVESVPGCTTSLATVVVDAHGTRQIYIYRGDAIVRAHPLDVRQLEGADLVLTDPRWPEGAEAALRWARAQGVPALLDADVSPLPVLDRLVPLARWVRAGAAPQQERAPAIEARDTTGAGDVFHAALGLALVEGRPVVNAVAWANAAAACKCEHGGGAEGAPTRTELTAWLRDRVDVP